MSTPEGENKDGREWPTQDSGVVVISPERLTLERYKRLDDSEMEPRTHAHLANQFRDDYMRLGEGESLGRALHHYEAALRGAADEPLLQAWVICHRVNIYIHDLSTGRALLSDLAEELELARDILSRAHTLRGRDFKARTLEWIDRTHAAFFDKPAAPEATQTDTPSLRLVGGTAIDGAFLPIPEPGPEAA